MAFLERFGIFPSRGAIKSAQPELLANVYYETGIGDRGLPMVRLNLTFLPLGSVTNPEMSLALLLDRSYAMIPFYTESIRDQSGGYGYRRSYIDGHVYQTASAILNHINEGYDLVFYDGEPEFIGQIRPRPSMPGTDLLSTIAANDPHTRSTAGDPSRSDLNFSLQPTNLTPALQGAVERYGTRRSLYIIVITKGEISDRNEAQAYVLNTLLPRLTSDNPYAYRLHFVGVGEGEPSEFLQQLETAAARQNVLMVKHHHHAHPGQSHGDIFEEMSRGFLGIADHVVVGEPNAGQGNATLLRVGNLDRGRWFDGPLCDIGFVPLQARIGLEVISPHPPTLDIVIRYIDAQGSGQDIPLRVPLPRATASARRR